jgi:cytochrome b561
LAAALAACALYLYLYLVLIALLSLGVATAIRDTAVWAAGVFKRNIGEERHHTLPKASNCS